MRILLFNTMFEKIKKNLFGFFLLMILLLFYSAKIFAQPSFHFNSRNSYIELYRDEAIKQMIVHGIPASITLAQGILESNDGNSPLAKFANNHFGIKCHADWDGSTYIYDDDLKGECFRRYNDVLESYEDHSVFIKSRRWYSELFSLPKNNYKAWAYGLKKAGYATEPRYAEKLIDIIEKNELFKYDKLDCMPGLKPVITPYLTQNIYYTPNQRTIIFNNGLKCIELVDDENFEWIAQDLKIPIHKLLKYNDYLKDTILSKGVLVYLEPKKHYNNEEFYFAKDGDTMHSIAQKYGIKLDKLCYLNDMAILQTPNPGQRIYLAYKKN
jgi:hypothetical protein